jgi:hypothetical protein
LLSTLHARLRVQRAPGIPHALCFRGGVFLHNSGASRREGADAYLKVVGCLKMEVGMRAKRSPGSPREPHSSCPDLIRASINPRNKVFRKRWITGSSPVMTISIDRTTAGREALPGDAA